MGKRWNSINRPWSRARALVFALALVIATGFGYGIESLAVAQQGTPAPLPSPADLSRTFVNIAKQVKPSVVSLDVVEENKRTSSARQRESIPFGDLFPGQTPRRQRGTGSGVIISPDGFILTNNHVAGSASKIQVKLADGREFKGRLIGTDPETDLAVVKIEAQNLPYAKLGNSDKLEQGEWVIALGSPFGLQQTMTAGIVSAIGRDLGASSQFTSFIQTDASINPGNSGGPLVNMNGEVVGINSMIYSRTGGSEGVGFSIPSNLVSKVYGQIAKSGKVTRAYLGLFPVEITPSIARNANYNGTEGALIDDLSGANTPAAKAGLRSGDIITEIDGVKIKSPKQMVELVADLPIGKQVPVKFIRDGVAQTTTVTLAERPGREDAQPEENSEEEPDEGQLGIVPLTITPELATRLQLKRTSGVIVQSVRPDSPAAEAGLRERDVILRVNRTPINTRQDLSNALTALKDEKQAVLQIERSGRLTFVTVTLE